MPYSWEQVMAEHEPHEWVKGRRNVLTGSLEQPHLRPLLVALGWKIVSNRKALSSKICECVEPFGFRSELDNVFARQGSNGITHRIIVPVDVPGIRAAFSCTVNLMVAVEATPVNRQIHPRLSVNIGFIMPEKNWHSWELPLHAVGDDVIAQITSSIQDYALPWFDRFQCVDDLMSVSRSNTLVTHRALHSSLRSHDDQQVQISVR